MQLPLIKCFNNGFRSNYSFFVLSKGENAGKPLTEPCRNCFQVICYSNDEKDYFYWLSWGLWKAKLFHPLLTGSVIPFLRLDDYENVITGAAHEVVEKPEQLQRALKTMRQIEAYEAANTEKMKVLNELKVSIFQKVIKR